MLDANSGLSGYENYYNLFEDEEEEEVHPADSRVADVQITDRFRRVPIAQCLSTDRDAVGECNLKTGHILRVVEGEIYCERCPARWTNEGF